MDENSEFEEGSSYKSSNNESVELPGAELRIQGDFNRLIQNIRLADETSTVGVLGKEWDLNIEEQEMVFRDDLRAASGIGKRRRKHHGRRPGVVLSQQVKALIGEGNQAYVDGRIQQSIQIMQEVIRIEPRAMSAWSVLANCYHDLGQPQKALQLRIMGAHLHHDAEEWERLAKESREMGFNQQALYCYGKVHSLDPSNLNALWDRAALAKEIGDNRTARNSLLALLKRVPHDLAVLEELRPILIELSDLSVCAELYGAAFTHYSATFPGGHGINPETGEQVPGGGYGLMEILVLADLYNTMGDYDKAIRIIRSGCRWLQGRGSQKLWDSCEDDREYNETDWRPGNGRDRELGPGKYPLDLNARHRLAVARIKMGDIEEGMAHANIVLSKDIIDYAPLFVEIADAYFDREMHAQARPIYEMLGQDAGTSSLHVLLRVATCYHMLGQLQDAAEVYETILSLDSSLNEAKMQLAEIYEVLHEPRKALDLVYQVIDSRKRRPKDPVVSTNITDSPSSSLFEESTNKRKSKITKTGRLTLSQLHELERKKEEDVRRGYRLLCELWPKMLLPPGASGQDLAEREWLLEAEKLVDMFRETRNLFRTSRSNPFRGMLPKRARQSVRTAEENENEMASRLHLDIERVRLSHDRANESGKARVLDNFRNVTFDNWLRLFMQYAFLLTKRGKYELADEVLNHVLISNAFVDRQSQDTIRLALIACAIHAQRYHVVVEHCRKFIVIHQFNNEPLRMLCACLASGYRSTDAFIASTLQKHLFREMRLYDTAVRNKDALKWNAIPRRWGMNKSGEADEGADDEPNPEGVEGDERNPAPQLPTKENPVIFALYGHICLAGKSYQSAIFYLLHAYDYCPNDPMICLGLAISSMGRAMQRQSDNRHHLIAQAMAFLTRYRALRQVDGTESDEVEYNFGRAFQQLGLHSLAVKHYERVLEIAEKKAGIDTDDVGLAREAAYNLSIIFVTTGANALAEDLYRRWLTL
ncbi:TPR-like protein [Russula earlei]|uniref:TPR-like protein n=1 Tax=Russula earlei TaxID=71964 RepID=A0ACC0ULD8_9AGAM|nr:TPR-like protein [Russula earlei]